MVVKLDESQKQVALYLGLNTTVCNKTCQHTQITNIIICPYSTQTQNMPDNEKISSELSSESFIHIQINADRSISHGLHTPHGLQAPKR